MKLEIISSQATGIFKALKGLGYVLAVEVNWICEPERINGMWRASIWV